VSGSNCCDGRRGSELQEAERRARQSAERTCFSGTNRRAPQRTSVSGDHSWDDRLKRELQDAEGRARQSAEQLHSVRRNRLMVLTGPSSAPPIQDHTLDLETVCPVHCGIIEQPRARRELDTVEFSYAW